jgi:hypothetical protein
MQPSNEDPSPARTLVSPGSVEQIEKEVIEFLNTNGGRAKLREVQTRFEQETVKSIQNLTVAPGSVVLDMVANNKLSLNSDWEAGVRSAIPISTVSPRYVTTGSFSVRNDIICPRCDLQHVDRGDWAKRLHRKHLCERCGCIWQPEDGYSFGI